MGREVTRQEAGEEGLIITVAGKCNRGKTTVARFIEEALRREGFVDVTVYDDPRDSIPNKASIDQRIEATKKRTVYIETVQLKARLSRGIEPGEVPIAED